MKAVVDNLNSTSGWSASNASIHGLNYIPEYIAGNNSASLIFKFTQLNGYVTKTIGLDVSSYDELVIWVKSTDKSKNSFRKPGDFDYKIDLGSGKEYYLPLYNGFCHVVIDISSITTIDRIRITSLHSDTDYLVVSYAVVAKDEFPLDIFSAIKEELGAYRDSLDSFSLGTINVLAGDNTIDLSGFSFVNDWAVIKITDGVNSEIHQLKRHEEGVFTFTQLYDGETIVNNQTSANVYLYLPIEFGRESIEAIVPGITLWGFEPEHVQSSFEVQDELDTWSATGASERKEGQIMKYFISFDCEARQDEILAHLAKIVRDYIGRKKVYVNGRKCDLYFEGTPVEERPSEFFDIIPKIVYKASIEIGESIWTRSSQVKTTTIDIQVEIQS